MHLVEQIRALQVGAPRRALLASPPPPHRTCSPHPRTPPQVIKSKTAAGFVPNFAAGGSKSMDRTEPPVGAKTLLDLYKKWGDRWVVELLFDDLLDWSNWFIRRRLLPPLDLVALGSYNEEAAITGQFSAENMQGARFESGLDNRSHTSAGWRWVTAVVWCR